MNTKELQTEDQKAKAETLRKIVLTHCVDCHQQLDLLQLRLINFDDLVKGVLETIKRTNYVLNENKNSSTNVEEEPTLKKV